MIGKWFLLACLLLTSASGCERLPKADSKAALAESPSTPTGAILPKARKSSFVMTVEVNVNLSVPLDVEKVNGSTLPNRFSVDCDGDGRWDHVKVSRDVICRYKKPGKYTIRIAGHIDNLRLRCQSRFPSSSKLNFHVLSIDEWGPNKWYSMESFSTGCNKMHLKTKSAPDLSRCISLKKMFYNAEKMNEPLDHWNVSKVRNMTKAFFGATSFNQPLEKWNVSKVENMNHMFADAKSFNQPLKKWNVSNVEYMDGMFRGATSFNQPLEKWNVSNVEDMTNMFKGATAFNQPLEKWNVSSVEDMSGMFEGATSFNQPLEKWNVSNVKDMSGMFKGATSFKQSLKRWRLHPNVDVDPRSSR